MVDNTLEFDRAAEPKPVIDEALMSLSELGIVYGWDFRDHPVKPHMYLVVFDNDVDANHVSTALYIASDVY